MRERLVNPGTILCKDYYFFNLYSENPFMYLLFFTQWNLESLSLNFAHPSLGSVLTCLSCVAPAPADQCPGTGSSCSSLGHSEKIKAVTHQPYSVSHGNIYRQTVFCKNRYLKLILVSRCWAQSWEQMHVCLLSSSSLSAPASGFKASLKSSVF